MHVAQREAFAETFDTLQKKQELDRLLKLRPCLDSEGDGIPVINVGGRLAGSHHLPAGTRSPVILPPKHRITQLIIEDEDRKCGHAVGPNHILSNLSDKY